MIDPISPASKRFDGQTKEQKLRHLSKELEVTFLAEMLKSAGVGKAMEGFGGGGIGEEQFASFTAENHARSMVNRGGIGLAESLFEAMKERSK